MQMIFSLKTLAVEGIVLSLGLMFLFWLLSLKIKNFGVVDIGWSLCLFVLCILYVIKGNGFILRSFLILLMVGFWSCRLIFLLISRMLREKHEDKRYQKLREDWKPDVEKKFLGLFLFEAFLAVILSYPFLVIAINGNPEFDLLEITGILVWFIGFTGEVLSDEQLKKFKSNPANKGKTCDTGFWYYSRHPNYFCEWLMWVGYFIFALASPGGWLSIFCPVIMYYFLIYVTGVPFAESQALLSRGEEYLRYQQSTSMFFPSIKKKIIK